MKLCLYSFVKRYSVRQANLNISYDFSFTIQQNNTCSFLSRSSSRNVFSIQNVISQNSWENTSYGVLFIVKWNAESRVTILQYILDRLLLVKSNLYLFKSAMETSDYLIGFVFVITVGHIQPSTSVQYNKNNTRTSIFLLKSRFSRIVIISCSSYRKVYHLRNFILSCWFHNIILMTCRE